MATFVESTVKDIDRRLVELKEEVSRLEAARSALVTNGRRPARRTAAVSVSRRRGPRGPSRPRGSGRGGNTRANQTLELVRNNPGITIPEIAKAMGIGPNYLYRVVPKLASDGAVRREADGWRATGG